MREGLDFRKERGFNESVVPSETRRAFLVQQPLPIRVEHVLLHNGGEDQSYASASIERTAKTVALGA
jgi:hypothetical protein